MQTYKEKALIMESVHFTESLDENAEAQMIARIEFLDADLI